MQKAFSDRKVIITFIAPAFILFTAVLLIPICYSIYVSFCEWNGITPPVLLGVKNYVTLFTTDDTMRIAIKNSVFFAVFSVVSQQIIGITMAVILTNIRRGRNVFKNIYYLPCVLSSAALGLLFSFFFNPKMGLNQLLSYINIEGPLWLMDINGYIPLPIWVIACVATWQYMGSTMLLYMAAISAVPSTVYEAAYIDGASKNSAFWHITLPLIRPMMKITISLTLIGSLKFFDLVYNMTNGGPNKKTEVLAIHLYEQGFKYFKYSYASAISVVLLVLCLLVTFITNKVIRTENYEF